MNVKRDEGKVKPIMKVSGDMFDLRALDTNIIVQHLDELIKARELPVEQHVKRALKKTIS